MLLNRATGFMQTVQPYNRKYIEVQICARRFKIHNKERKRNQQWFLFLFLSGLRTRERFETNNEEKRKNNLNLNLSKSLHHILDFCILDHPCLWTIIFLKLYSMGYILLPQEFCPGWSSYTLYRLPAWFVNWSFHNVG